jgi:hypothetical protein
VVATKPSFLTSGDSLVLDFGLRTSWVLVLDSHDKHVKSSKLSGLKIEPEVRGKSLGK